MKSILIILFFFGFTVDKAYAESTRCDTKQYDKITIYYKSVYYLYSLSEPWGIDDFLHPFEDQFEDYPSVYNFSIDNRRKMKRLSKIINEGKPSDTAPLLHASKCADFVVMAYGNNGVDTISVLNCPECPYEINGAYATNPKLLNYIIKLIILYDVEWNMALLEEKAWRRHI